MRLTSIVVCSAVLVGFVPSPQTAYAQRIEKRQQAIPQHAPGDIIVDDWTVSIDRTSNPGKFELKGHFSEQYKADQYARKLLEWAQSIQGDWRPKTILVEDTVSIKQQAKEAAGEAKDLAKGKQPVGGVLSEYKNRIADAYRRVVDAKQTLLSYTGKITQQQFKSANNLIQEYNSDRDAAIAKTGYKFSEYPRVSPVTQLEVAGRLEANSPPEPKGDIAPGTYLDSFDNGDGTGARYWKLVLSENGAIQGNLKWGSKSLNVSGIWKFENGGLWIQWQGGDFKGTPKWHEVTEYRRWRRQN